MSERRAFHVVPYVNSWTIREGGAGEDRGSLGAWDHKDLAVARARELAHEEQSGGGLAQVVLHGEDGQIQQEWTYGEDPASIPG